MKFAVKIITILLLATSGAQGEKPSEKEAGGQLMALPIPVNEEVRGIKIPYFDSEGKIQMHFDATTARRVDETHLQLSFLNIEIFDENGESDMMIRLPASMLDMVTEVISSKDAVQIKNRDFQLTGEAMTFNTRTKEGILQGKVRMVIFNRAMLDQQPEE